MSSRASIALQRFKHGLRGVETESLAMRVQDLLPWVAELRRLAQPEAQVVFPVALECLRRLRIACEACERTPARAADVAQQLAEVVGLTLRSEGLDKPSALRDTFQVWLEDATGVADGLARALLDGARSSSDLALLTGLLRRQMEALPLVLPPTEGAADELRRTLLIAERHRIAHFLGEALAASGSMTYAVLVAKEHWRRTADVLDLLHAMERAGMESEALAVAERALENPRTLRRAEVIAHRQRLLNAEPVSQRRSRRRERERTFLAHPSREAFLALKASVVPEHWPRVRMSALTHILRLRDEGSLVFTLWCEEGAFSEAHELVRQGNLSAETLRAGADLAERSGAIALAEEWRTLAASR